MEVVFLVSGIPEELEVGDTLLKQLWDSVMGKMVELRKNYLTGYL